MKVQWDSRQDLAIFVIDQGGFTELSPALSMPSRGPYALDLTSAIRLSRLALWSDGSAQLSFATIASGQGDEQHRTIQDAEQLRAASGEIVRWIQSGTR